MRKLFLLLALAVFVVTPVVAFGVELLPNDREGIPQITGGIVVGCEGPGCQACHLIEQGNRIVNFAIGLAVLVATLMFMYAGWLYVTAAANPKQIEEAHKLFRSVLFGFLFVLAAWLIINVIVLGLTGKTLRGITAVPCVDQPGGSATQPTNPGGIGGGSSVGGSCAPLSSGPCSVSSLTGPFGSDASTMSSMCHMESGGNPTAASGIDKLWYEAGNPSFSYGLFQLNIVKNDIQCGGTTLNCPAAFNPPANPDERRTVTIGGRSVTLRAGAGYGYTIKNTPAAQQLYHACIIAATTPSCNIAEAKGLYDAGGLQPWATTRDRCNL